ncbi:coadhesin-like [Ostrea edulis]|uniref:coadhesin-like n=1 Tax=Ostrea edulis TaxID=37623 RepID=UPI0024AF559D|nr:coadhesin-like [Ostrea edulis]
MRKNFILIELIIVIFFLSYSNADFEGGSETEKRSSRRVWCNPRTGLRITRCISWTKIKKYTYRKCGFWLRRRCKSGTKYYWISKSRWCTKKCKVNGGWSAWRGWRGWGACYGSSCVGHQTRYRLRTCTRPRPLNGGRSCRGPNRQWTTRSCKPVNSIVNGNWGSWGHWKSIGTCSKSCGNGKQMWARERTCSNPAPRCGGKSCPGTSISKRYKKCLVQKCEVDGGWSAWGAWTSYKTCSKTCGSGQQFRHKVRYCTNPPPSNGGKKCKGKDKEKDYNICNVHHCPVDGKWSEWGSWGHFRHCSETCGYGVKYRYRHRACNNPEPKYDGKKCPGLLKDEEFKRCFLRKCPDKRVNGKLSKTSGKSAKQK